MRWIRLLRPFTLFPPALGMVSGAASALGAGRCEFSAARAILLVVTGALMAAVLNGASNVLNQIHDVEIDRINKPERPLPRGELSLAQARAYASVLYLLAIVLAFAATPGSFPEVGVIVAVTAVLTWAYSGPPLRLRNSWWLAPLVISVPRGWLLKVAGWGSVAPVFSDREPWVLGFLFFLFILGAASTKDFTDTEGDRQGGVVTLPIRFGAKVAARIMAPFYVIPWILLGVFSCWGPDGPLLTIRRDIALVLAAVLALHGAIAARRLVRDAEVLADPVRGRGAWRHLYLLMMEAQIGIGVAYLF